MKKLSLVLLMGLGAITMTAQGEDAEKKSGLLPKKVDKPIPDTYEPLDGADWNHRLSPELQTLREYQDQQAEEQESEERQKLREKLEVRIQEPGADAPTVPAEPEIEETGDGMRIGDPQ